VLWGEEFFVLGFYCDPEAQINHKILRTNRAPQITHHLTTTNQHAQQNHRQKNNTPINAQQLQITELRTQIEQQTHAQTHEENTDRQETIPHNANIDQNQTQHQRINRCILVIVWLVVSIMV